MANESMEDKYMKTLNILESRMDYIAYAFETGRISETFQYVAFGGYNAVIRRAKEYKEPHPEMDVIMAMEVIRYR